MLYDFSGDYALLCPENVLPEFIIHTTFAGNSLRPSSFDSSSKQAGRGKRYYFKSFYYCWDHIIIIIFYTLSSRGFRLGYLGICAYIEDDDDDDDDASTNKYSPNTVRRHASKKQEIASRIEDTSMKFSEARKSLFEKLTSVMQLQFS